MIMGLRDDQWFINLLGVEKHGTGFMVNRQGHYIEDRTLSITNKAEVALRKSAATNISFWTYTSPLAALQFALHAHILNIRFRR